MFAVLAAIREESVLQAAVDSLSGEDLDVLMKVIYRGLRTRVDLSGVLLKWHGVVLKHTGPASIMRVLTDRRGL